MTAMESRFKQAAMALTAVGAIGILSACAHQAETNGPLTESVQLASGGLLGAGRDADGVLSFKGIPYAAPPVGPLRWRAPQPLAPWAGQRSATAFGPTCWQSAPFDGDLDKAIAATPGGFSEDCLFANVWTPARERMARLPVMVWLHGGGFQFGSGNLPPRGGNMVLAKKGVVVVSLNYRLGVFGYLAHPALTAEAGGIGSGAYGLQDIQAGLSWVRANIAQFGGDPQNVTVFGESAGAHAIGMLMASPLSQGLFDKAIGQSGAFWESENTPSARPLADAHKAGSALAAKLGAPSLAALREVSALTLQRTTNWTLRTDPGVTHWAPVIDGLVLPESPYDRYAKGLQMKLPLLVGWNASEGLPLFANRSLMWAPPGAPAKTVADFRAAAQAKFGADRLDEFLSLYPGATVEQAQRSANQLIGDEAIAYQVWAWAVAQQRTAGTPVYVYHFTHRSAFLPLAMHTAEIPFAFGDLSGGFATGPKSAVVPGPDDLLLAERMSSFWINFARSGNPNGDGLPQWPRFEGPGSQVMQLNSAPGPVADPDVARHRFLHRWKSRE